MVLHMHIVSINSRNLTSLSCSWVFDAPPNSWLTSAPTALEGPAPSEPVHMSDPVTRVRRAIVLLLLLLTCQQDVVTGQLVLLSAVATKQYFPRVQ